MQLAQGLRPFSAAPLPAAAAAPRTTRVSDEDRKELHRARLEAQAAAEKERAETEAHVRAVLVDPDTSIYDILMVEFVLQPDIPHEAGAMRALYLKQLKAARDFDSVPRQRGVANMTTRCETSSRRARNCVRWQYLPSARVRCSMPRASAGTGPSAPSRRGLTRRSWRS